MTTNQAEIDVAPWNDRLIATLKEKGAIRSAAAEAAFRRVLRHRLLECYFQWQETGWVQRASDPEQPRPEELDFIYADQPVITRTSVYEEDTDLKLAAQLFGVNSEEKDQQDEQPVFQAPSSSTSQPGLVAAMLEHLALEPGLNVLEIGAGTGYHAALMAEMVGESGHIVAVDIQADVIEQTGRLLAKSGYGRIKLLAGDGFAGAMTDAPYDRIVATVGCPDLSPAWTAQLKSSGFMLIPLAFGGWHPLTKVWLEEGRLKGRMVGDAGFMVIQGELALKGPWPFAHAVQFPFQGFEELAAFEPMETKLLRHFYDFIVVRDRRAFWTYNPAYYGLFDKARGVVVVQEDTGTVLLKGEPGLYADLQKLYVEWQALGKPQRADYELEFIPLDAPLPPLPENTWLIERKFYRQLVRLKNDNEA
ncbi:MAG: methyltransferase domain-containing protein [Caldilineaceae bacterium]